MHGFKTLLSAGLLAGLTNALPKPIAAPTTGNGEKLVVYWGAMGADPSLMDVCKDPSYDIINLSFLSYFHKAGGYPEMHIASLNGPSAAQKAAGATGLLDGTSLVPAITACQMSGKKVLLSLGGAKDYADSTFKSDSEGVEFADLLWDLFGGAGGNGTTNGTTYHSNMATPSSASAALRPFGNVRLDGFDLDNESGDSTGYLAFVNQLRRNFSKDPAHKYLITAAPQCTYPDKSVPLDVCTELDYVWVQFYNNGDCNLSEKGFEAAVQKWSKGIGKATLFVGGLASNGNGNQGYVPAATMVSKLDSIAKLGLPNYGGAMLWDAQAAAENHDYQKTIAAAF